MSRTAAAAVLFLIATACTSAQEDDSGSSTAEIQAMLQATEAAMQGYEDWGQIEGWQGTQPGDTVHGPFVEIRWNPTAEAAIHDGAIDPMPVGSLIVKQGYEDVEGTVPINLTVMNKYEDFGWFFASWSASGDNLVAGAPPSCTGCHDGGIDSRLAR